MDQTTTFPDGETLEVKADGTEIRREYRSDPRWGEQVRYASFEELTTPGGLTMTREVDRAVQLGDPNDLFSLLAWTQTETVNGRSETVLFDAVTRTLTHTFADGTESAMVFDELAQMVELHMSGQYTDFFEYDDRGLMTSARVGVGPDQRVTEFEYDDDHKISAITNPLGQTLGFEYDDRGLPTMQVFPDGRTLEFGYDANGELTEFVAPSEAVHELIWTEGELFGGYRAPATATQPQALKTYHYSEDRELVRIEFADGRELEIIHGDDGLVERIDHPGGSDTFVYEPSSDLLVEATTADGEASTLIYDGPLIVGYGFSGTIEGDLWLTYDNDLRLVGVDLDGSPVFTYVYNTGDQLTSLGPMGMSYEAVSGRVSQAAVENLVTSLSYNDFGELTAAQTTHNSSPLYDLQMEYDALGRIATRMETIDGEQITFDYSYGEDGRLTEVFEGGVLVRRYTYDENGNRTLFEDLDSGENVTASYDARDRILERGNVSYQWSPSGELMSRNSGGDVLELDYDVFGGLRAATLPDGTELTYASDYLGRRIGRFRDGVFEAGWVYDTKDRVIAEFDSDGQVESFFVHAPEDSLPELMIRDGQTYRFLYDQVGSPRLIVDATTGTIAQRIDYDEFGRVTHDSNPGFQPFGFASGLYDRDTGLVRFGARDYDPELGRWTAPDPLLFNGDQYNLYEYALSDPINRVDPEGLVVGLAMGFFRNFKDQAKKQAKRGTKPKRKSTAARFHEDVKNEVEGMNTAKRLFQGDFAGVALDAMADFAKKVGGNAAAVKATAFCGTFMGPLGVLCGAAAKTAFDAAIDYLNEMAQAQFSNADDPWQECL